MIKLKIKKGKVNQMRKQIIEINEIKGKEKKDEINEIKKEDKKEELNEIKVDEVNEEEKKKESEQIKNIIKEGNKSRKIIKYKNFLNKLSTQVKDKLMKKNQKKHHIF